MSKLNQPFKIIDNQEKKMPCNIEAEQSVIGSILVSNEIYDEVSQIVDAQKFFDPIHSKIFETIVALINKGLLANPITLKNFFENDDGLILKPAKKLVGATLCSKNDHRLFMAFCIAGMYVGDCTITDPESVEISYPNFVSEMKKIGGKIFPDE